MVIKRNGKKEPFDFDKIYKHIISSTLGLDVDENDLINNFRIRIKDEMNSSEIQESLKYSAADLISQESPDWQYVSARLELQDVYKRIYGSYIPIFNYDTFISRINKKYYNNDILEYYSKEEFNELTKIINFKNDFNFTYLGLSQMTKKYAIKENNYPIETPQEIFFLLPLYIFRKKEKSKRKELITKTYNALSNFDIFFATPPMAGIRTNMKGFTSCAGVDYGDSIESFGNASKTMFSLITKLRAGIGADPGSIRGIDADIGNGLEKHTGITPYLKVFENISLSSQQPSNGRSGAITNYYPFFHWEIENIITLKNNKGSDENSVRHSDHAIIFNDLFYERLKEDKYITLFHMNIVKDLYNNIGQDNFKEEYEKLERKHNIKKKKIKAKDLYDKYLNERYSTARLYKINANEMQRHGAFNLPNYKSNLCTEINLPSFPDEDFIFYNKDNNSKENLKNYINELYEIGKWYDLYKFIKYDIINETNKEIVNKFKTFITKEKTKFISTLNFGETFSCILGGFNMGNFPKDKIKRKKKIKEVMYILVNFLDEMIDYQDYANINSFEKFTKNRRALGLSPGNLFNFLAKENTDYNSIRARNLINEVMEEVLYFGMEASINLAKENGKCKYFNDTKYSNGILPFDTYNKNVDKLCNSELKLDWKFLKENLSKYGMRNSTLLTSVPGSNSSRPGNMISGINPPQALVYNIEDQKIKINAILPDLNKYKDFYKKHIAWNIDVIEYWKLIAVFQKWIDQSISLNEYIDFIKYPDSKIPEKEVIKRDIFTTIFGIKSLYYAKTKTDESSEELEEGCSSGGCTL